MATLRGPDEREQAQALLTFAPYLALVELPLRKEMGALLRTLRYERDRDKIIEIQTRLDQIERIVDGVYARAKQPRPMGDSNEEETESP